MPLSTQIAENKENNTLTTMVSETTEDGFFQNHERGNEPTGGFSDEVQL